MLPPAAANLLRLRLRTIPDLCALAAKEIHPTSSPSSGMPGAHRCDPQMPLREDVISLLGPAPDGDVIDLYGDQTGPVPVAALLSSWCEVIWGQRCNNIAAACYVLQCCHDQAIAAPYAETYAEEIAHLYRRLTTLVGVYTAPVAMRCPACHKRSLETDPGRGYRCVDPDCASHLTADLYDHLAIEEAARRHQARTEAARRQAEAEEAAAAAAAAEQQPLDQAS